MAEKREVGKRRVVRQFHNDAAIILAGGRGSRFGGLKQDVVFRGKPLWRYPYDLARELLSAANIVVVGRDVKSGETRSESVVNGLHALPRTTRRVVILEAARPLVTKEQICQLLKSRAESVTLVKPLVNTVIGRDGTYFNRSEMYELLVPQAFNYAKLRVAYDSGRFADMTDETRVMFEYHGIKPRFILAGENLFKVTYPSDIHILSAIYENGFCK